jgi:hypothetical protein
VASAFLMRVFLYLHCCHYGPDGNRIAKKVFVDSLHRWTDTYYTHDATGNIMATYQWINRDTFNLDELVMYGSSRLGTYGVNLVLSDTALRDSTYYPLFQVFRLGSLGTSYECFSLPTKTTCT